MRAAAQERFEFVVSPAFLGDLSDVLGGARLRRCFSADDAVTFVAALRLAATFFDDRRFRSDSHPTQTRLTWSRLPASQRLTIWSRETDTSHSFRTLTPPVFTPCAFLQLLDVCKRRSVSSGLSILRLALSPRRADVYEHHARPTNCGAVTPLLPALVRARGSWRVRAPSRGPTTIQPPGR